MEKNDYIRLFEKFLDKQATSDEVKLLIEWLKKDNAFNHWADEQWLAAPEELDPVRREALFHRIQVRINRESKPAARTYSLRQWLIRTAAMWILLIATGTMGTLLYFQSAERTDMQDTILLVEKGQKAGIILPDGTKAWLNSDSKLTYGNDFNRKERLLHLEGEAYFEVAPDQKRAFIVQANELSVKALGTSFNLKSYPDETEISATLITGKLEVKSANSEVILYPNEKSTYHKQSLAMEKAAVYDAKEYVQWKNNTLSFDAETFENIAKILERHYNIRIVFESEALKGYKFTGKPNNTSLESILQILSQTSPLLYEMKDSEIILRENAKQKAHYERALK
jgi:ferric-dicitrate binding protein FerR (iron transport regulator)